MEAPAFDIRNCGTCPIQKRAICARCEPDELAHLDTIKYYRTYEAGQPISWMGDKFDFVASVVIGVASLTQVMSDGRTQMVGLLLPSDFLGHPNRNIATFDVTAITDVTLCCFRHQPFRELIQSNQHVSDRLLEMTLDELDAAREWMLVLGRKTAREKIASFLLVLARREIGVSVAPHFGNVKFILPLTREEIANYLGLTLETVSRQISALRNDGVISIHRNREVDIADISVLAKSAGDGDI